MRIRESGLVAILTMLVVLASGCINSSNQNHNTIKPISQASSPSTWEMKKVWGISTAGIPFMDLRHDGKLAAVIDYVNRTLYLVRPDGKHVKFKVQENDWSSPVIVGVFIINDFVYVPAMYAEFIGSRVYTWSGLSEEIKFEKGIILGVIDAVGRSPNGNYVCYLATGKLYCQDFKNNNSWKFNTGNAGYGSLSVSDEGYVVIGGNSPVLVVKDGKRISSLNADPSMGIVYKDKIITQINNSLTILDPKGKVLASNKKFGFHINPLNKITPVPSEKYIFAFKAFEKTHVLDWNLKEVRELPGYPEFANENFVVTSESGKLHCYSLKDFHEVWTVKPPVGTIGYVKISDDAKVLLVSGHTGDFYLYKGI